MSRIPEVSGLIKRTVKENFPRCSVSLEINISELERNIDGEVSFHVDER